MKKQHIHFVPRGDSQLAVWASNIGDKISIIGPQLGMDAAAVTKVETAALNIEMAVKAVESKRADLEQAVSLKNESKVADVQVIADAAAVMKRHPDYREQLGSALGIVGYVVNYDPKDLKPVIKARTFEGKVEISFNLQQMSCITIYSRLKGTNGWTRLGNDYESPFIDSRPLTVATQPEIREYAAMYFNLREDVGQMSQIETIVFAG
ncbi:hypothetical protein HNQ91_002513 [Filimonas zeae]|nr:hypothetical protein [Filimonas zeae]MDR6339462.1 hypothetical protein [Filimonas zeae]